MTSDAPPPRRLRDLPGIDALELQAVMKPRAADPDERDAFPEIAETARAAFGLTPEEAEAVALPFHAEPDQPASDWGSNLKAEATRFRKR